MSRRRHLSDEEEALWSSFVRSIAPLRPAKPAKRSLDKPNETASPGASPPPSPQRAAPQQRQARPAAKPSPPSPFDRRLKKRVARGHAPIEARIDLHGLTQSQAHAALLRFLRRAQADGARIVLVVTGKGGGRGDDASLGARGVLKRQVPLWLSLPEFRPFVVGIERAHVAHGGEGALYVRIRRLR